MISQEQLSRTAWHALTGDEALERLEADAAGLSAEEQRARLERFGTNVLTAEESSSPWRLILHQLKSPLIYVLAAAAAVSVIPGKYLDAAVIGAVIILNTLMGFFQEYRAEKALESLRRMTAPKARILRGGEPRTVDAAEVVPGDILLLETGDRLAADVRLLQADDLEIDESALTGESEAVSKDPEPVEENTAAADRAGMAWMSTAVTGGRGRGVVVATGMASALGRIAGDVRTAEREDTPLQKRLGRLGMFLGFAGLTFAALVFGIGLLTGYELLEMALFSVAVAVSAIPEGLPAVISVTLALGVRRMAARHAIIRRLPAVETLGSTTVICSDKTGTITHNEMTVTRLWCSGAQYRLDGDVYKPEEVSSTEGNREPDGEALGRLAEIGILANNAQARGENGKTVVEGSPTESALLLASLRSGEDLEKLSEAERRLHEIPFSSSSKYMAVLTEDRTDGRRRVLVKGAPDRVVDFCTHILDAGKRVPLDDERRKRILAKNEELAGDALRVIAGAYKQAESGAERIEPADAESDLTFAGLWGLLDPPREDAVEAIAAAKEAGIHVVMITGDHARTATAIAHQAGIAPQGAEAVTGIELDGMSNEEIARAAFEVGVFARVTPAHKLKIMQALKERGEIVAMTGDGVNDAPALKGADIGVAMGQAGTEVAKDAADMVLLDDNFATIVHAVEEGRGIYRNLQRVVYFLLATNLGEILALATGLVIGLPLPLTAIMVLWINLVTDGACTVPLGVEPRHRDVLKEPPRKPGTPILEMPLIRRLLIMSAVMAAGTVGLFFYEIRTGSLEHARTVAFTTLAAFQWFQAFNARSRRQSVFALGLLSNRWLLLGVGVALGLQLLVVYTAAGQALFGTVSLTGVDWALIVGTAASILVIDEVFKALGVHKGK